MAIDADPSSPGFNCYVSVAEADVLAESELHTEKWDCTVDPAVKEQALLMCTGLLDTYIRWKGDASEAAQNLGWPRRNVRVPQRPVGEYYAADTVPEIVKLATLRYANVLLTENILQDQETGLTGLGVGSIRLQFSRLDRKDPVPRIVRDMLVDIGTSRVGSGFAKVVRV